MADNVELIIEPQIDRSIYEEVKNAVASMKASFNTAQRSINNSLKNANNGVSNKFKTTAKEMVASFKNATTSLNSGWKNSNNFIKKSFNTNFRKIRLDLKRNIRQMNKESKALKPSEALLNGWKKLGGIIAGTLTIGALKSFTQGSLDLYKMQNLVETKLKANMKTVESYGGSINKMNYAFNNLKKITAEIQSKGVIGDEILTAGAAQMSTFQMSETHISELLPKFADILANLKGTEATIDDAQQLGNTFGKALSMGTLDDLVDSGIIVDEATKKMFGLTNGVERTALLVKILEANVGDVNQALGKTPEGQIKKVQMAWAGIKEEIGKAVIPMVLQFSKIIQNNLPEIRSTLLNVAKELPIVFNNTVIVIKKVINAIAQIHKNIGIDNIIIFVGAFTAMANIVGIITGIIEAVIALKTGITAVNMAMLKSPLALVFAGIALAIYQIYKNWDLIKATFFQMLESIKSGLNEFKVSVIESLGSAFEWLGNKFTAITDGIMNGIKSLIIGYISLIQGAINTIISGVNKIGKYFKMDEISQVDLTTNIKEILNVEKTPETFDKKDIPKNILENKFFLEASLPVTVSQDFKTEIQNSLERATLNEARRKEIEMGLI